MNNEKFEWETGNGGAWGTIETSEAGFILHSHSRYQGTMTDVEIAIPASEVPWAVGEDLGGYGVQERIKTYILLLNFAEENPHLCRIISPGFKVQ